MYFFIMEKSKRKHLCLRTGECNPFAVRFFTSWVGPFKTRKLHGWVKWDYATELMLNQPEGMLYYAAQKLHDRKSVK